MERDDAQTQATTGPSPDDMPALHRMKKPDISHATYGATPLTPSVRNRQRERIYICGCQGLGEAAKGYRFLLGRAGNVLEGVGTAAPL